MPELRKKSSTTAPTPHSWDLEGEPGGSNARAPSPAPSNPRSVPARSQSHGPATSQMSETGDVRYSESTESTGTVRRIAAESEFTSVGNFIGPFLDRVANLEMPADC